MSMQSAQWQGLMGRGGCQSSAAAEECFQEARFEGAATSFPTGQMCLCQPLACTVDLSRCGQAAEATHVLWHFTMPQQPPMSETRCHHSLRHPVSAACC